MKSKSVSPERRRGWEQEVFNKKVIFSLRGSWLMTVLSLPSLAGSAYAPGWQLAWTWSPCQPPASLLSHRDIFIASCSGLTFPFSFYSVKLEGYGKVYGVMLTTVQPYFSGIWTLCLLQFSSLRLTSSPNIKIRSDITLRTREKQILRYFFPKSRHLIFRS